MRGMSRYTNPRGFFPMGYAKPAYMRRRPARRRKRRQTAGVKALREVRKMKRTQEVMNLASLVNTAQIPIGGAAIIDGFGPYCQQGDAAGTRDGNKITIQSLAMRFNVKLGALEADGAAVRIMIVYDRRPDGADAVITDMLNADDILAFYNTVGNSKGRFQFLADRVVDFSTTMGEWSDKFFIKRNFQIEYSGNVGTVADVDKGNFLVVGMSRGNAAAIDIDFGYMFKYIDG